eukprot:scaffold27601_cov69-Cyclotella_meneghiniana.AAC.1
MDVDVLLVPMIRMLGCILILMPNATMHHALSILVAFYPLPVFTRDDLGYEYYPLPVVLGITYQIVHLQRPSMPGPGIAEAVGGQIGASSSVAVVRASEFRSWRLPLIA